MTTFLDVNVAVDAAFVIGGAETPSDFADSTSRDPSMVTVAAFAKEAATKGSNLTLVSTTYSLATVAKKLADPASGDDPLDRQSANRTAMVLQAICRSTGGEVYSLEQTKAQLPRVQRLVESHRIGRAHGQVDHEDLMILAGCVAAAEQYGHCVLVTRDEGLLACARDMHVAGVAILRPSAFVRSALAS